MPQFNLTREHLSTRSLIVYLASLWMSVCSVFGAETASRGKLTTVCLGQEVAFEVPFKASPGTVETLYWSFDDPVSGADNTSLEFFPRHIFGLPGRYEVKLRYETSRGDLDTLYFPILVLAPPQLAFTIEGTCVGDRTVITATGPRADKGRISSWKWIMDDDTTLTTAGKVAYRFPAIGRANIQVALKSVEGCAIDTSFAIDIMQRPEAPVVPQDTFCVGAPVQLQAVAPEGAGIQWYDDMEAIEPFASGPTLRMDAAYFSRTIFIDRAGAGACRSQRVRVPITVFSPGEVQIRANPETPTYKVGEPIEFSVETTAPLKSIRWAVNGKRERKLLNLTHTFKEPGRYEISLKAVHANGCEVSLRRTINVPEVNLPTLPVAFSPNGDGINDAFSLEDDTLSTLQIQIFNRWGQLVFSSRSPSFSWDGRELDGRNAPDGVYVYKLVGAQPDGAPINHKGVLTLIR